MGTGISRSNDEEPEGDQAMWERRVSNGLELSSKIVSRQGQETLSDGQQRSLQKLKEVSGQEARRQFKTALKISNLFSKANDELVGELFNEASVLFVKRGDKILEKGAIGQVMFVVVKGAVTAVKDDSSRTRHRAHRGQDQAAVVSRFHTLIAADAGQEGADDAETLRIDKSDDEDDDSRAEGDDTEDSNGGMDINARRGIFRGMFSIRRMNTLGRQATSIEECSGASQRSMSTRGTTVSRYTTSHGPEGKGITSEGHGSDESPFSSRTGTKSDVLNAIETVEDKEYGRSHTGFGSSVISALNSHSSRTLGPGRAFGTHCVLLNTPHSWTVSAKRDTLLLAIHSAQFQEATQRVSQRNRLRQSQKERMHWLQRFPFLHNVDPESLDRFAKILSSRSFGPGETVCEVGKPLEGMYIVLSGTLAMRDSSGEEVSWFRQGDCVGRGIFLLASEKLMSRSKTVALRNGLEVCVSGEEHVECLFLDWQEILFLSQSSTASSSALEDMLESKDTDDSHSGTRMGKVGQTGAYIDDDEQDESSFGTYGEEEDEMERRSRKSPTAQKRSLVEVGAEVSDSLARDMLQSCSLFGLLSIAEIGALVDNFELCFAADNEVILSEGDSTSVDDALYMVLHGVVELSGQASSLPESGPFHGSLSRESSREMSWRASLAVRRDRSQHGLSFDSMDGASSPLAMPLVHETETVLLLDGDTFGEDCLDQQPDGVHMLTCRARGAVVCARFSRKLLKKEGVLDKIRRIYVGEPQQPASEKRKSSVSSAGGRRRVWRRLAAMSLAKSFSMSDRFLLLHELLEFESGDDGTMQARRRSLKQTINNSNLKVVSRLHKNLSTKVFLAMHTPTIQLCVVKSTNVDHAYEAGMGKYILAEQTILSQLESPFIIKLLSAWTEEPAEFVALEPALAGSLEHRLSLLPDEQRGEFGGMPFEMCRFFAAGILLGLKHLYELRIVHRDIKTVNILVDHHGYPKLADFGYSKALQHRTSRTSTFVGSPRFMAPEQAALASGNSNGYGLGVDWWAFGCVMYKLATGVDCFSGKDAEHEDAPPLKRSSTRTWRQIVNGGGAAGSHEGTLSGGGAREAAPTKSKKKHGSQPESFDSILSAVLNFNDRHHSHSSPMERRNDRCLVILSDPRLNALDPASTKAWRLLSGFIAELLHPDAKLRLGANHWGPRSALQHSFFQEVREKDLDALDFDALFSRQIQSPLHLHQDSLIVDTEHLRSMHRRIRHELKQERKKRRGPSMQVVMEDDEMSRVGDSARINRRVRLRALHTGGKAKLLCSTTSMSDGDDDDDDDLDDDREGISKRPSGSGAAGMSLLTATERMQSHSVQTLQTVASEMEEIEQFELDAARHHVSTVEEVVRRCLETVDIGGSQQRLREETKLQNRRRAKILDLKRRTQVSGSIGAAILYRAISAEEHHRQSISHDEGAPLI
ncbi:Protein kinase, putative [Hondaea fermentalgiana]|uniref:Protein kinase, putative n=1 Tax=Hondaea fermentalgiana TaxID=2315210 RepID=A0A2R5FZC5_9STRA|nr:Protein kinase, putative [Hondaea fermentalgiana]|eukprot:GBG24102.1 Protein kinase, putative [Hondaea fermentalgiana]